MGRDTSWSRARGIILSATHYHCQEFVSSWHDAVAANRVAAASERANERTSEKERNGEEGGEEGAARSRTRSKGGSCRSRMSWRGRVTFTIGGPYRRFNLAT